ncbi:MAG: hypothetical protein LIP05_05120 [Tannerellaceae bacterium]|nr:hypothetical protein [Tannerellaceae bacterium]
METSNTLEQLKRSFYEATGKDLSAWEKMGIPYMALPDLIYFYILHSQKEKKVLDAFTRIAPKYHGINPVLPAHRTAFADFLSLFREKKLGDNERFISSFVRLYLPYFKNDIITNRARPRLPHCENKDEVFVDLITGISFIEFYPDLKEDTFYYLVDASLFVCEGLRQAKESFPHLTIQVIRKNVLKLDKKDFHAPISILRAKNLFGYVSIHKWDIQNLQGLIRPGGRFVFQEYSYRKVKHAPKVATWFKGWKKIVEKGNAKDKNDLDTITYIKPY